ETAPRPPATLVVAERREEGTRPRQTRELHGRDRAAAAGLLPGVGRVHDVARGRDELDVAELDPLRVPDDGGPHAGQCGILDPWSSGDSRASATGPGAGASSGR